MTRLPADYLADAEKRARRYMGQWTGTAGSLAADVIRLLHERTAILTELSDMTQQLEDANAQIRRAIEVRREAVAAGKPHDEWYEGLEAGCCDGGKCHTKTFDTATMDASDELPQETSIPVDWILRGEQELQAHDDDIRWTGDSILAQPAGTTSKFGTGAVRSDSVEEFRYDLVSPIGLREVARACAEGAAKYGDWNWEKGMPVHDLLNHAIAHIYGFLSGDRSEPHLGHAAWNVLAAIHSLELWPHLNAGHLRERNCRHPDAAP